MPSSIITAGDASNGLVVASGNDGAVVIQSGPAGAKVNALSISATGNITLPASAAPAFSAYKNTPQQSISSGVFTKVTYDVEEFDTNNNFSASRFTPTVAGYYSVTACTYIQAASGLSRILTTLYKNGAAFKFGNDNLSVSTTEGRGALATLIYLNGSTDYIEIYVLSNGTTLNVTGSSTSENTFFQAFLARSA